MIIRADVIKNENSAKYTSKGFLNEIYNTAWGLTFCSCCGGGSINIFANYLENFSNSNFDATGELGQYRKTPLGGTGTYNYGTIKTGVYLSFN